MFGNSLNLSASAAGILHLELTDKSSGKKKMCDVIKNIACENAVWIFVSNYQIFMLSYFMFSRFLCCFFEIFIAESRML